MSASDDDWERDYSLLPHIVVDGQLQRPVGFVPLRTWISKKEAKRLNKKKGRTKRP